ncbi:hypothetical protein EBR43_03265 [bacterium]|nr:hypothetical protein [bacterium]
MKIIKKDFNNAVNDCAAVNIARTRGGTVIELTFKPHAGSKEGHKVYITKKEVNSLIMNLKSIVDAYESMHDPYGYYYKKTETFGRSS